MPDKANIAILISGRGSNMLALLDAPELSRVANIVAVMSNDPTAAGLALAAKRGIATHAINHKNFASREAFDAALTEALESVSPELLVLAGFMRILTPAFTAHWEGRMLNIHPSVLPAYPGLHTHARALMDGASEHGATVHFVTSELDGGPAVLQARVPVLAHDDETQLAARVLEVEHQILPLAVRWFASRRLTLEAGQPALDGKELSRPLRFPDEVSDLH